MHVLIFINILMLVLLGIGLWRHHAFYLSVIIIILFVALTGFQVSAIRASIMGLVFLLARKVGRKSVSTRTIVITSAVMLAFNPLMLLSDVGFQLSFVASLGIIYMNSYFERWLKFIPNFANTRSILAVTLSAYIFTLPIIIYNFGRISLIAPVTNILVLPIVPFIMVFGLVFIIFGSLVTFPIWFLLGYLLKVLDLFSSPIFSKTISNMHFSFVLIFYLVLGFLIWHLNKKQRLKYLN